MEDHWEVGVVLAFRDMQWLAKPQNMKHPRDNIGLSGRAEFRIGDSIYEISDEKFFILEYKSDQAQCSSEWNDPSKQKSAFLKLRKLVEGRDLSPDVDRQSILELSARCHHLAFWAETQNGRASEGLFLSPYLLTALTSVNGVRNADAVLERLQVGVLEEEGFREQWPLSLHQVLNIDYQRAAVVDLRDPNDPILLGLGVTAEELNCYVKFLCAGGEKIKALILGDKGFIRVIQSLSELTVVLSKSDAPHTKGRTLKLIRNSSITFSIKNTDRAKAPQA